MDLHNYLPDPVTVHDVQNRNDWPEWQRAMDVEMAVLTKLGTWELADRPPGRWIIQSKWVFQAKYTNDGRIDKYKA